MSRTGTYTLDDLKAVTNESVRTFGLADVADTLQAELDAHNEVLQDIVSDFAEPTTQKVEAAGGSLDGEMEESDEFTRARTQKVGAPEQVGFPLRNFQMAIGWTRQTLDEITPRELAVQVQSVEGAHIRALTRDLRSALFNPVNYTFTPYVGRDKTPVNVKALRNGDGSVPPMGPNLETFDGTHSHYMAGALSEAQLSALIGNVAEHGTNSNVRVYINRAQEAGVKALGGFVPYVDGRVLPALSQAFGMTALDTGRVDNRAIGLYDGAEIWVKPWVFPNYQVAVNVAAQSKPLKMREPENAGQRGLRVVAELETFPLYAEYMEARFGFGASNRDAAAVNYSGGGSTYVAPSF